MIISIEQQNDDFIRIGFPFNEEAKDALKDAVEYKFRKFDWASKSWIVENSWADKAIEAIAPYGEIADERKGDDVEEMKVISEIAEIKKNQQYIIENKKRVTRLEKELSDLVASYSFRSKSRVKAGYARNAALLRHSVHNAEVAIDEITEVQVRGLAAAVRYLEEN